MSGRLGFLQNKQWTKSWEEIFFIHFNLKNDPLRYVKAWSKKKKKTLRGQNLSVWAASKDYRAAIQGVLQLWA